MDVRSIEDVEPIVEHNGTVPVWWLVTPREMHDITTGGYLELVSRASGASARLLSRDLDRSHGSLHTRAAE